MEFIKKYAPLLLSVTFWGLTLSAFAGIVAHYGWLDEFMMQTISEWLFTVTGVNVIWKGAKKISLPQ